MGDFVGGGCVLLAALLASAGLLKLLGPAGFSHAVFRLLPERLHWRGTLAKAAAPVVGAAEVAAAGGLLASVGRAGPGALAAQWATAALTAAFVAVVAVAIEKGTACGCWSSFSDGPAGGAELSRAVSLALLALVGAALRQAGIASPAWTWGVLPWAVGLGLVVAAAAALGGRLPVGPPPDGLPALGPRPRATRTALYLGAVWSDKASFALPTTITLRGRARARAVDLVRASSDGRALESWAHDHGATVDWDAATVRRTSVRQLGARARQVRLRVPAHPAGELNFALRTDDGTAAETAASARIGDERVVVSAGEVVPRPGRRAP